ncbi:unnamed protein product [Cladocopium goreaui]|uniref:BTB domain-containing protein n=1 Tax=Cladocopium goreaui TaxID=2562237 RepID=A0A9P1M4P7_9DINO|nr:unnamed protein product [Cladocopium goreaui]
MGKRQLVAPSSLPLTPLLPGRSCPHCGESVFARFSLLGDECFAKRQRTSLALAASVDPRSVEELTVNAVSSSDVLRAGQYSFRISIGWSLGRDMSTQAHSMLGVAVERVDRGVDIVAVSFELKLVNQKFPEKSVVMSTEAPLGITERGLKGWFPAPYADRRESADGFVLLKEVLDPAKGWLENDSLVVECTMTVGVSQPHSLDRKGPPPTTALEDLSSDMAQLLESEGDVCLQVGQEVITAHSIILSTRSPVFKAMLSHSMKEQSSRQVEICDLEASAVYTIRTSTCTPTATAAMSAAMSAMSVETPWFVAQKVLLLLKLKLQNNQEISRDALLACECPGDNEDDEVLLPVDFRTLEEHFGFGGEGEGEQPELVDEDGRMDLDFLIGKFGEKGVAEAFVKAQQVWLENRHQIPPQERDGPIKAAEWKREWCVAAWGEEGEEEELLEEDAEYAEGTEVPQEEEEVEEPALKRRVVAAAVLGDNEPTVALLQAAHRYQVKGLVDLCVAAVASNLKLETSADRLMLAEHIGIDSLKRDCLSMMVTSTAHVREVQHSEAYRHLRSKRPALAADLLAAAFPSKTSRCTVSR